ncbi:hypothetical protein EDD86DRAFT_189466 [Gorgonomyces haynaldii]|nr:hypothetical protein EDD86DRAFT_189466 [Gorgonomyces haynaldii]
MTQKVPLSPATSHSSISAEEEPQKLTASEKKKLRELARNLTCFNCKTNKTPLWRRTHDKQHNLCNACGLYYKQYQKHRPIAYKDKQPRQTKRPCPIQKPAKLEKPVTPEPVYGFEDFLQPLSGDLFEFTNFDLFQ